MSYLTIFTRELIIGRERSKKRATKLDIPMKRNVSSDVARPMRADKSVTVIVATLRKTKRRVEGLVSIN